MQTDLIGRQFPENLHCLVKVVYDLLLGIIIGIAFGLQRTDTGAVLIPLMHPQVQVIASKIFPVNRHVVDEVRSTRVN